MNEQETRKKIAQILATQLCPNKNAHFASWGSEANCYSRMNFVECEKMADATDALIAENIGDTSELFGKIEQLKAENAELRARLDKAVELPVKLGEEVWAIIYGKLRKRIIQSITLRHGKEPELWLSNKEGTSKCTVNLSLQNDIWFYKDDLDIGKKRLAVLKGVTNNDKRRKI